MSAKVSLRVFQTYCLRVVSVDIKVFQHTSVHTEHIFETDFYPTSATNFWSVATKGAIDRFKRHNLGVGTVVQVVCGRQLWYLFRRRGGDGRISTLKDWHPDYITNRHEWNADLVVLEPGNALYVLPVIPVICCTC